jgi:hypothetical protein
MKPTYPLSPARALEIVGSLWGLSSTNHIPMYPDLAGAFAQCLSANTADAYEAGRSRGAPTLYSQHDALLRLVEAEQLSDYDHPSVQISGDILTALAGPCPSAPTKQDGKPPTPGALLEYALACTEWEARWRAGLRLLRAEAVLKALQSRDNQPEALRGGESPSSPVEVVNVPPFYVPPEKISAAELSRGLPASPLDQECRDLRAALVAAQKKVEDLTADLSSRDALLNARDQRISELEGEVSERNAQLRSSRSREEALEAKLADERAQHKAAVDAANAKLEAAAKREKGMIEKLESFRGGYGTYIELENKYPGLISKLIAE